MVDWRISKGSIVLTALVVAGMLVTPRFCERGCVGPARRAGQLAHFGRELGRVMIKSWHSRARVAAAPRVIGCTARGNISRRRRERHATMGTFSVWPGQYG